MNIINYPCIILPVYGIDKDHLIPQAGNKGVKGHESLLPTPPIVSDPEDDDALFLDCEDPDVIAESDDDVEYVDVLKEQPSAQEQPLEDNQTQSWLGWATTNITSFVMSGISAPYGIENDDDCTDEPNNIEDKQDDALIPTEWIDSLDKIVSNVMESETVTKLNAFSNSKVGSTLIETGKTIIAENAGMLLGAALSSAFNESTGLEEEKAFAYVAMTAAMVAGGWLGRKAVGSNVSENYISDTTKYLVLKNVIDTVTTVIPLPAPISTVVAVSNTIFSTALVYYPEEAKAIVKNISEAQPVDPAQKNLYDPGKFVEKVAMHAQGDTSALATSLASSLVESPLISSITQILLKHTIDKKLGTNALVRAVNDFVKIIQDESIQKKIKELKATPDETKKDFLKKEIASLVAKKYGIIEKKMAKFIQNKSDPYVKPLVKQLVDLMSKKEVEYMGMELSDADQTRNLLEILLPSLIPMVGVYAKREIGTTKDLSTEEIETFYQNFNAMIFAPYNDYSLVRGVQGLISIAIPFMQQYGQIFPRLLAEMIGEFMVDPIITFDDDVEFDIPVTTAQTAQKVEEKPKKGVWASIRAQLRQIRFIIQYGRMDEFMQIVKNVFIKFFIKKARASMNIPVQTPKKPDSSPDR